MGTTLSAGGLEVVSGRDTALQGATIVADGDITAVAGRNLTIESAENTRTESSAQQSGKSGLLGTWYNPSIGKLKSSDSADGNSTTHTASQVASLQGDVTLVAGEQYRQTGSSVAAFGQAGQDADGAGGNVNVLAKSVLINEAVNTEQTNARGKSSSTVLGGSANVGGISTDTARSLVDSTRSTSESSDSRMQALAAANVAFGAKNAYDTASQLASGGGTSYKVTATLSHNKSEYETTSTATQAVGSSIAGANNVNIVATGGGQDSNIYVIGSTIAAGKTVNLAADNQVTLEASQNTFEQHGTNKSSGQSVGVGYAGGSQNGITIELGASRGKGSDDQSEVTHINTHVSGGEGVNIISGGDLNLKGAVVEGKRITADVGGNLNIESLQDTSEGHSKQSSSGANLSLCIPPICYGISTVSANAAKARAQGDFESTNEQSGLKAGDGGFDVNVKGNTDLKGAVIESIQTAIDAGNNSFNTGGQLTVSDLHNRSQSDADGYSVSGTVGTAVGDQSKASTETAKRVAKHQGNNSVPGGGAGAGSSNTNQASVTKSGISGVAGDQSVRTGDASSAGALAKEWNTQAAIKDVQNQAQVTQQFSQNAAREIGTYAGKQASELREQANQESDPDKRQALQDQAALWDEGGAYRVALHSAAGLLSGGVGGLLANGVTASVMPLIGEQITSLGLPGPVEQALGAVTAASIGGLVGGSAGAGTAFSTDINNRLLHHERALAQRLAKKAQEQGLSITVEEIEEQMRLMGNEGFGVGPNSVSAIKGGVQELVDSFLADPSMPRSVSGNFVVEVPGVPSREIQQFIIENTTNEPVGSWIPGVSPYVTSLPPETELQSTQARPSEQPRCANLDTACASGVGVSQNPPLTPEQKLAIGAYLGRTSTNYQRAAALATASGNAPIAVSFEIAAAITGLLEHAFSPSTGKVVIDTTVDEVAKHFSLRSGIPLPVVLEAVERVVKPNLHGYINSIDKAVEQK